VKCGWIASPDWNKLAKALLRHGNAKIALHFQENYDFPYLKQLSY